MEPHKKYRPRLACAGRHFMMCFRWTSLSSPAGPPHTSLTAWPWRTDNRNSALAAKELIFPFQSRPQDSTLNQSAIFPASTTWTGGVAHMFQLTPLCGSYCKCITIKGFLWNYVELFKVTANICTIALLHLLPLLPRAMSVFFLHCFLSSVMHYRWIFIALWSLPHLKTIVTVFSRVHWT